MANLYLTMTEKLTAHWKANSNTYPQKFVLTSGQRHEYDESCRMCGAGPDFISAPKHMGVSIEVTENTPGVMVAAHGTEVMRQ